MLICFDYDGVIADTFERLLNICKESHIALNVGRVPQESDFRETESLTFDYLARQLEIPEESVNAFAYEVFSRLGGDADPVFDTIPEVLTALAEHHILCVVTANTVSKVTATLEDDGIQDCFSTISGGEEGLAKSEQISRIRSEFGVSSSDTIMVGDTLGDIRMAKAAGVKSIAVTWGYQTRDFLESAKPDFFASTPKDLLTTMNDLTAANASYERNQNDIISI